MNNKIKLKTPITYYGGKQQLSKIILELIPEHRLYCEPFCGGAAIFFAKEPATVEILNDTNREIINFFKVAKMDFVSLEKEIRITMHSRSQHHDAHVIYTNPHMFSEIKRAWAIWVLANQSINSIIDNSWSYERKHNKITSKTINKRMMFTEEIAIRLQNTQVECTDANYIITSRDCEDAFFYCDPPYINTCQGHYDGYTEEDFKNLLDTLAQIKGKFLLSSFPSDILTEYIKKYNWISEEIVMRCTASKTRKKKIEVLTKNYVI